MESSILFRVSGTVIVTIWWKILLIAGYTCCIATINAYLNKKYPFVSDDYHSDDTSDDEDAHHHHDNHHLDYRIEFPQLLIPVLGVVTSLLLVFRTNTAYDRYWEGRRTWSTMTLAIRTLTRCIWVMVESKGTAREVVEKTSAINLLIAYAYAIKNYLREEFSYDEEDLVGLIRHIPKFSIPTTTRAWDVRKGNVAPGKKVIQPTQSLRSNKGGQDKSDWRHMSLTAYAVVTPTNIPLELSYYIASYIKKVNDAGLIDSASLTQMNNALTSLVDCLTIFERIQRTPIPLAYSVHLHQAVWLYLVVLPVHIVGELNWFAIPAVILAAFSLLGLLGIGCEIENPFGYHPNDLPLDDFCKVIQVEIQTIMGHHLRHPDSWILSRDNQPLGRASRLSAIDLIKMGEPEVQSMLTKNAVSISNMGLDRILEEEALLTEVMVDDHVKDDNCNRVVNDGDENILQREGSKKSRH